MAEAIEQPPHMILLSPRRGLPPAPPHAERALELCEAMPCLVA